MNKEAKYFAIYDKIRDDIRNGTIKPNEKLPSENELCKIFDVSRHTVRKALEILTDENYIYSLHGSGTFCKDNELTRRDTKIIAVITTYISNYIFPEIIEGIDSEVSKKGYSIILKNTKNSRTLELKALEDVLLKNVDGIIIEPSKSEIYSRHIDILNKFYSQGIPVVFLHSTYPQFKNKPSILIDDTKGAYLCTKALIEKGCKNFAGVFKTDDAQGRNRHIGFVNALNEHKIQYKPQNIIWYHSEDQSIKPKLEINEIIKNDPTIDAVVCYNDKIASNIAQVVDKKILLSGFDNSEEGGNIVVATINHPKEKIGRKVGELLLNLMENPNFDNFEMMIDAELILKE